MNGPMQFFTIALFAWCGWGGESRREILMRWRLFCRLVPIFSYYFGLAAHHTGSAEAELQKKKNTHTHINSRSVQFGFGSKGGRQKRLNSIITWAASGVRLMVRRC